tara:strand:- start:161 stop:340 length:180 start_codon:yes stop_codon:yes gene_type:complete
MAYTEMKLKELLKDLRVSNIPDDEAFDIADGIVFEEEGLKEFLLTKGITDPVGYIADRL